MRKPLAVLACCFLAFSGTAFAVHLVPDKVSDPHFTSGPCPMIVPLDGAACANGASQCPAFYNPDIQVQQGAVFNQDFTSGNVVLLDPLVADLAPMDEVLFNVQSGAPSGTVAVDTIREYSELAAEGWNIDYSTLRDPYHTVSPLAKWYRTCFDANGVFSTAKNANCKFSVTPQNLKLLK